MSLAKNYLYNVAYQIITLVIPLITVPYVSRVLGADGIGINAYTNSIVQYFILFGTVGISLYGNRTIAYVRNNKAQLTKTFWSIVYLQIVMSSISFVFYILFIILFAKNDKLILILQSINLLAAGIDISWLLMGIEDFRKTVTRNLVVKIIGVICIFIFVTQKADLWKYTLIISSSMLFGQIVMWAYLPQIVERQRIKVYDVTRHIAPSFKLFLPQIAIQIYLVLNKTMIGWFSTKSEVGIYENSDKIVKMVLTVLTATGTVMLPRISNVFARGEMQKVKDYINKSLSFVSYLGIPMMLGLASITKNFVPWFFGADFLKCTQVLPILSPILVAIAWSNVLGIQYMIPTGKSNEFTISVTAGALVNFILNLILIRRYASSGAAISTMLAEIAVTLLQIFMLRKDLNIIALYKDLLKYLVASILMTAIILILGSILKVSILSTAIQVFAGLIIYVSCLFALKSEMNSYLFSNIRKRLRII